MSTITGNARGGPARWRVSATYERPGDQYFEYRCSAVFDELHRAYEIAAGQRVNGARDVVIEQVRDDG